MRTNDPVSEFDRLQARDASAALTSAGGDAELSTELLNALISGLPAELDALRVSLGESDWPGLAEYAHQMRGATQYCGVPALDAAIEALERAARVGDPERCTEGVFQVELQAQRLSGI